jgi:glyoxylase-like metal-dependent hydrolase (beta-lactamase superfamily II)
MHTRDTLDVDVVPRFTAVYLRAAGDECAFIETHTAHALPKLMAALEARRLRPESVRWVVVTHAHLDHAAGASALLARCPNAQLLAHPRAARHLVDPAKLVASATAVYGAERFEALYGRIDPIPAERVRALEDGARFPLGDAELRVFHTAGHAKHHFVVDDPALSTVYTGDTFGLVYPALQRGARFALATTSPTDFDANEARRSIDRVLSLGRAAACLTHFGEVRDLDEVAAQIRRWIDRSEAWVASVRERGETDEVACARMAAAIRDAIQDEARTLGLAFDDRDMQIVAVDIDLNAKGLVVAARRSS